MAGSRSNSGGRPTGLLDRILNKRVQALAEVHFNAELS